MIQFLTILFVHVSLVAQVNWQKMNSPNETVTALSCNSSSSVYAGTLNYGVFETTNAGSSYQNISQGLGDSSITSLGISSADEIFAGTKKHGVYRYNGGSWTQINNGLPADTLIASGFAKGSNGTMYMITTSDNVYKWDGNSWSSIKYNLPTLARVLAVTSTDTLLVGCFGGGIYKFDGNSSWTNIGAMPNSFVTRLVLNSLDSVFVACNSNYIYKKPLNGGTWSLINSSLPALNASVFGRDELNNLYIGFTESSYGKIYKSSDSGSTWALTSAALETSAFASFVSTNTGIQYFGASGVYKTTTHGSTWIDTNPGLDARKAIVCFRGKSDGTQFVGILSGGVWRSTDNGVTWQQKIVGLTTGYSYEIIVTAAGTILYNAYTVGAIHDGVIFRSTNNGNSWTQVASNSTDFYTRIRQHASGKIWLAGRFGGPVLSYSTNDGATWTNNPISGFSAIWDICYAQGDTIFVGSESEGVTRSDNGGASWIQGVGNSTAWYGNVLQVERDKNHYTFAGSDWWQHILWFSAPGSNGNVWTEFLDSDLDGIGEVNDLIFDDNNNAYFSTSNGQYVDPIFMANATAWNENTNWFSSSTGLPPNAIAWELSFDAAGYLFCVFHYKSGEGGLYRSTVPLNNPLAADDLSLEASWYAPHEVDLQWTSPAKQADDHFEIERSADALTFEQIGIVGDQTTTTQGTSNNFVDHHPADGINYYRIKRVSAEGNVKYSPTVSIVNTIEPNVRILPNPSTGIFTIRGLDHIAKQIKLLGMDGSILLDRKMDDEALDLTDFAAGVYVLKIETDADSFAVKLFKQ